VESCYLQARQARSATEELYAIFAEKTSLAQISAGVIASVRPKMQLVEEVMLRIVEKFTEQPPVSWLVRPTSLSVHVILLLT